MKELYTSEGLAALKRLALATQGISVDLDIDDPTSPRGKEFRDAYKYADSQVLKHLSIARSMSREDLASSENPQYEKLYLCLRNLSFASRFRLHGVSDRFVLEEANSELKKASDQAFEAIEDFKRSQSAGMKNTNQGKAIPCFVDQDGNVHTINPMTGKCTHPQDIEIVDGTIRILGAFDESDPQGQARLVVDEFTLYGSLSKLSQVLEEGLSVEASFQNEKSDELEIKSLMAGGENKKHTSGPQI